MLMLSFSSSEVALVTHIHVELSGGKQMAHYFNILLRTASGRLSFLYFNEKPYLFFYLYYEKWYYLLIIKRIGDGWVTMWSMLLFWIPVCIGIVAFCYFVKHSRTNKLLMLSFLPIVFFIVQIVKYTYIESQEIFIFYVVGLFISVVFFIMILSYFYKK